MYSYSPPLLIVPDTNVIVSGTTSSHHPPGMIIEAWKDGVIHFALCEQILSEVAEVLTRPYFQTHHHWMAERINAYVDELREGSLMVLATAPLQPSPDPKDNMLFSCAVEAGAQYIVSGDARHVLPISEYKGIQTLSPTMFVDQVLELERVA